MLYPAFQPVHAHVCHVCQLPRVSVPLLAAILLKGAKFSICAQQLCVCLGQGVTLSRVFCDPPSPCVPFAACVMSCINCLLSPGIRKHATALALIWAAFGTSHRLPGKQAFLLAAASICPLGVTLCPLPFPRAGHLIIPDWGSSISSPEIWPDLPCYVWTSLF